MTIRDHDPRTAGGAIRVDQTLEAGIASAASRLEGLFGSAGDDESVAFQPGHEAIALDGAEVACQRNVVCSQDDDGDRYEHRHQPPSHPGASSRNPTPRTASIQCGSPSFLRIAAMCASTVLVGPNQLTSHTFSRMSVRVHTAPGSTAR